MVHVAIENANATHPILAVVKPVYGVSSLATLKGGYGDAYARQMQTHKRIHVRTKVNAAQSHKRIPSFIQIGQGLFGQVSGQCD